MLRILTVLGTRPEAIKMAPIIHALNTVNNIDSRICITAQHRDMLDSILKLFDIQPHYDLNIMQHCQSLTHITTTILTGMANVIHSVMPDYVLVHGDTTTALATALSACYAKIPVGHVEAGLRTGDFYSPWPEEMNRRLIDAMSNLCFAPTEQARYALLREGIEDTRIKVTGNTVIDALLLVRNRLNTDSNLIKRLESYFSFLDDKKLLLVTAHRRESFGGGFKRICTALSHIAKRNDVRIVYPLHANSNVREPVNQILGDLERVNLIEPQDYLSFVFLMTRAYMIITDSGGIQEEAPLFGKPVLLMRERTERSEALAVGTMKLVGTNVDKIYNEISRLLDDSTVYQSMSHAHNPYGDGKAAQRIVEKLIS